MVKNMGEGETSKFHQKDQYTTKPEYFPKGGILASKRKDGGGAISIIF